MSTDPAFPTTAGWRPHPRYPDPAITALDPRFEQYWLKQSAVERLYTRHSAQRV
jgi:gluconolactonase